MEEKIDAGARFFQTQAVYDPDVFQRFMRQVEHFNVPVLAGFIVLKSGRMARYLNENLPGISVSDAIIGELDAADDRPAASSKIAARIIQEISPMCQGVHIMAIGWESHIPQILKAADLA